MGEKYDSCGYERDYRQPQIMLSFLPEEYRVMQAWGDAGRSAFSRYDARRDDDVRQACAFVREQLTAAGGTRTRCSRRHPAWTSACVAA
jgi:hypothetical protein